MQLGSLLSLPPEPPPDPLMPKPPALPAMAAEPAPPPCPPAPPRPPEPAPPVSEEGSPSPAAGRGRLLAPHAQSPQRVSNARPSRPRNHPISVPLPPIWTPRSDASRREAAPGGHALDRGSACGIRVGMVQRLGSERKNHERATTRAAIWCIALAGAGFGGAAACATGVDVSQAELAEICSEPNIDCLPMGLAAGSGGASGAGPIGGTSGSSGSGTSGTFGSGGIASSTGGTTGSSGSSGSSGSAGASGSAGSSGTVLKPLAKGMCMSTSSVVIVYTDRGSDQQASMTLK